MKSMFQNATSFNQNLNNWDVSNVTNMNYMLYGAISFNQCLDKWDVSKAENMYGMFLNTTSFNQNIKNWNVSNVTNMQFMFYDAIIFNYNIGKWNVTNRCRVENMFSSNTTIPFHKLNVKFFFDGKYKNMKCNEREKIFDSITIWSRRNNFMMFLSQYGYKLKKNKNI